MTRLEDLLYSLTTVLIRYHDYQRHVVNKIASDGSNAPEGKMSSRKMAMSIIQNPDNNVATTLQSLISDSFTAGYSQRRHLLNYLLNEIVFLKKLIDNVDPIDDLKFEECADRLTLFFLNIRTLLQTKKSKTGQIELQDTDEEGRAKRSPDPEQHIVHKFITLDGLINDDFWGGGYYCRSAELIDQEVLTRAHMGIHYDGACNTLTCTDDAIQQYVADSISEQVNTRLVPQISAEISLKNDSIRELQERIKTLEERIKTLEGEKRDNLDNLMAGSSNFKSHLAPYGGLWSRLITKPRVMDESAQPYEPASSDATATLKK